MKTNVALAVVAAAMLMAMELTTGRIPVNDGRGFDGVDYSTMLDDLHHASWDARLRPAIVLANRPAYKVTGTAVDAFRIMNYLYAGLVAWLICVLFDRYASVGRAPAWTGPAIKTLLVANLFITIAFAKFAAFYPVLVDLGAMVLILAALVLHLSGRRLASAIVAVAAVLAREFALALVLFGAIRDWRQRVPGRSIAATWLPPLAAWFGWRLLVVRPPSEGSGPQGITQLAGNLAYWLDPVFVSLFVYFVLTTFGGISLVVFARARLSASQFVREPEWAGYALFILAAAAAGKADIWRYLMYLLPVVTVLFAVAWQDLAPVRWRLIASAALVCLATLVTQRPYQRMDMTAYFRDWFPYYLPTGYAEMIDVIPSLWPLWAWRFLAAAGLLLALAAVPHGSWRANRV
jgi:hypothetical protein